jgi:DNA-binding NtrC family response regulator
MNKRRPDQVGRTVLVVENQPELIEMINRSLKPSFNVQVAHSARQALFLLATMNIDLVVLGESLSDSSLRKFIACLKADQLWRHVPIIWRVDGLKFSLNNKAWGTFSLDELPLIANVGIAVQMNLVAVTELN